jgi:hypothetical protein
MNQRNDLEWAVEGPPVGMWLTALGSFDLLMQDTLWLAPDGTGYLQRRSVMSGGETFPVLWKQPRSGTLAIVMLFPEDDPWRNRSGTHFSTAAR